MSDREIQEAKRAYEAGDLSQDRLEAILGRYGQHPSQVSGAWGFGWLPMGSAEGELPGDRWNLVYMDGGPYGLRATVDADGDDAWEVICAEDSSLAQEGRYHERDWQAEAEAIRLAEDDGWRIASDGTWGREGAE